LSTDFLTNCALNFIQNTDNLITQLITSKVSFQTMSFYINFGRIDENAALSLDKVPLKK